MSDESITRLQVCITCDQYRKMGSSHSCRLVFKEKQCCGGTIELPDIQGFFKMLHDPSQVCRHNTGNKWKGFRIELPVITELGKKSLSEEKISDLRRLDDIMIEKNMRFKAIPIRRLKICFGCDKYKNNLFCSEKQQDISDDIIKMDTHCLLRKW